MSTQKTQILLSVAIRFLIYFTNWMVLAHIPVQLKLYGFTDIQVGVVIGFYSLSSMFLMLPMGTFSDFFSPKRAILFGALLFGAFFSLLLIVRSFVYLLPAVLLGGLGTASLIVVSESLYLKLFGQEQRGWRVAIYQVSTYLGFGSGPLVGGILILYHPALMFEVAVAGACCIFLLALFLIDYEPIDFSIKQYGSDIFRPKPLLLLACIFVIGTHFGVEQTSISLFMTENLGFSSQKIGYLFAGLGLWMAAVVPFIGRMHDRGHSMFFFLLAGLWISGLFQILTAWVYDFRSLLMVRLIHTLGDTFSLLELSILIAVFFPSQRLGGNSGLLYAVRTLATFLAAILSGIVNRQWGYAASFLGNGAFVLLFASAGIIFIRMNRKRAMTVGWSG